MKAIILLATLKNKGRSNTETLVDFLGEYLTREHIGYELIRLASHTIVPGTFIHMDTKDD